MAGSLAMVGATRALGDASAARQRRMRWCIVLAPGSAFAAFALDVYGHRNVGLEPDAQAWRATVGVLLGYQGFHLTVLVIMSIYLLARSHAGAGRTAGPRHARQHRRDVALRRSRASPASRPCGKCRGSRGFKTRGPKRTREGCRTTRLLPALPLPRTRYEPRATMARIFAG
ncbi:hypothetical protein [Variovorax sp. ZT4R33]|uniref:hypothetical protein n=1 Tax=Variovorax sp. ZT4R33 TaxID=3443743 RepID=UPI003F44E871